MNNDLAGVGGGESGQKFQDCKHSKQNLGHNGVLNIGGLSLGIEYIFCIFLLLCSQG